LDNSQLQYKCPNCGGSIVFSSGSQKMTCPYCDAEFEPETLKKYDETLKKDQPTDMSGMEDADSEWTEEEASNLRVYNCKSCGGEIVTDETTAATACPYCGNPVVLTGQLSGGLKPDCIIPFKLDKKKAMESLSRHLSGKTLLPKVFKTENKLKEIKGVYVPFWLYDATADADISYKAEKVRTWSDYNYFYTEHQHYSVTRGGSIAFANIPADGSSKMADDLMESIEPFDVSETVDFQTAYLSGYFADRYDVTSEQCRATVEKRISQSTSSAFAATVTGYSSVVPQSSNIRVTKGKIRYALYPVWLLNTEWNGKKYTFAMNGQTGKFVGDLPLDKGAYFRWLIGLTIGCGAAVYLLLTLVSML